MEALLGEFSTGLFIWQTVLFLGLVILLRKLAWKPILSAVNEREESIVNAMDAAKKAEQKMQELTSQNESLLKEARFERDSILKEAKEAKNAMISEAKELATQEANKILAEAKEQISLEKAKAITELKNQVAVLSIEIAEKILKSELSDKSKQEALVNNLMEDVTLN